MYDFSKNVGDTIHLNDIGDVVVEQTGTITLNNGDVRKKMVLKDLNPWYTTHYTWVDGIGDIERDFFRSHDFEGGYGQLICVRDSSGLIYYNPVATLDCDSLLCPVPYAYFKYTCNGRTFQFANQSYNDNSVLWDFGDGTTSTEDSPVHTFTMPGCYTVRLTVGSDCLPITQYALQMINVDAPHRWEKTTHQPPIPLYNVQFLDPQHAWGYGAKTIWRTSNGGATWDNVAYPGPARPISEMQFRDFEHGIFKIQTLDSTYLPAEDLLWINNGNTFSKITVTPHQNFTAIERVNDSTAVVASQYGGIYTTKDTGASWTHIYQVGGVTFITDFESPDGQTIYFQGVQQSFLPFPISWGKSTDGLNWTITPVPDMIGGGVSKISFVNLLEGWLCSGGIYHTTDGGEHWDLLTGPFTYGSMNVQFADQLHGWTSSYTEGVYGTSDGGLTWTQQACVLKDASIRSLNALNDTTAFLLADGDLYRYTVQPHTEYSCGITVETTTAPDASAVSCMPNPANNYTTIVWNPTVAEPTTFLLYNIHGQVVREINLKDAPGNMPLLTATLPAGVYGWLLVNRQGKRSTGKLVVAH